jgi:hypothetical protein
MKAPSTITGYLTRETIPPETENLMYYLQLCLSKYEIIFHE